MFRWIVKWLFGRQIKAETDALVQEARELLSEARALSGQKFVHYERFNQKGPEFIHGIQSVVDNKYVFSWLCENKRANEALMFEALARGDRDKVCDVVAQNSMVDTLLADMAVFKADYEELQEVEAAQRNALVVDA